MKRILLILLALFMICSRLAAAPCRAGDEPSRLRLAVAGATGNPAPRLAFETTFAGHTPVISAPKLRIVGQHVEITIPVADAALPSEPGASDSCASDDIDLGPLASGVYTVGILYEWSVGGVPQGFFGGATGGFVWDAIGFSPCSTTRTFRVDPPAPVAGTPVTIHSTRLEFAILVSTAVATAGHHITVTDSVTTEIPTQYTSRCMTTQANLGPLAAGAYDVDWRVVDFGVPNPAATGQLTFTVNAQAPAPIPTLSTPHLALLIALLALCAVAAMP